MSQGDYAMKEFITPDNITGNHIKIVRKQLGLTQKELVHCKIIRDADKTDIFYLLTFLHAL